MAPLREGINCWPCEDISGAILEHGDMGSSFCERRDLVLVVKILGSEMAMDHSPDETLDVGYVAAQCFAIVVISCTENDEVCGKCDLRPSLLSSKFHAC